jgi:hypothetical protein
MIAMCVRKGVATHYIVITYNILPFPSDRSHLALEMEACLYLWGSHLSSDCRETHTTRTTIVLAFWQISDNVWSLLGAVGL